jgi:hypothetical protein
MYYLLHVHHHEAIDLRVLLFIEAAVCQRHVVIRARWWRLMDGIVVFISARSLKSVDCTI